VAILTRRETWSRPRPERSRSGLALTDAEVENVRRALVYLRARAGTAAKLAASLGVKRDLVNRAATYRRPSAGLALAVARFARVSVDDVLAGRFPEAGTCPYCGHRPERADRHCCGAECFAGVDVCACPCAACVGEREALLLTQGD
jgi:hypothetical protein